MCILLWEQPCKKGKKCWTPNVNLRSAPNALFPRSGSLNPNMIGYLKKKYIIVIYFSSCQCYLRLDKLLTCQQQDLLYHHAMIGCSGKDKASVRSSSKNTFPSIIMWDKDKFLLECKEKEKSLCCWNLNSHGSPIPSVQKRDSLVQVHTLKSKCSSWAPSHGWTGCANCTTWQGLVEEGKRLTNAHIREYINTQIYNYAHTQIRKYTNTPGGKIVIVRAPACAAEGFQVTTVEVLGKVYYNFWYISIYSICWNRFWYKAWYIMNIWTQSRLFAFKHCQKPKWDIFLHHLPLHHSDIDIYLPLQGECRVLS